MNKLKAYNNKSKFSKSVFVICFIFLTLLISCGLDTFYYIVSPKISAILPSYTNTDVMSQTFNFNTNVDVGTEGGLSIVGTEIYYKIYNDEYTMNREKDALISKIDKKDFDTAEYLFYPNHYAFQPLHIKATETSRGDKLTIPVSNADVTFRLTDSNLEKYTAFLKVGNSNYGTPVRNNGKSFNFNESGNKPLKADNASDVKIDSDKNDGNWYVCLFAVNKGHDQAWSNKYSTITYIGSVKISDEKAN